MEKKNSFWKGALCGALAMLLIVGFAGGGYFVYRVMQDDSVVTRRTEKKLEMLRELIDEVYLRSEDVSDEDLREFLIKGYVSGLGDPYSVYYDKDETESLFEATEGKFGGIGVSITQDYETGAMTFVNVYEDGAGAEAGFQAGDILYKVDGEDVTGQDLNNVVAKIKGKEGSNVEITVFRGDDMEEYTATATRKIVEVQTVEHEMKDDGVGYIQITEFDDVTYDQFTSALEDLTGQGMTGLVIDLRNNPGGNLDTVCDILDLILPEGTILSTKDKNGEGDTYTSDEEHKLEIPMSVLTNENSASASEIFAGAIQDYGVGTLVGTTTFGKGIVQQIFPLTDGTSIKLTISEYFTPSGRNIHGIGIEPDVEIEYEYDVENPDMDNQLEKAIEIVKGNGM